jgi:photosystem II stability/assembly factor-like uncharacterized protein
MTDNFRDMLESERRRYRMPDGSWGALERRRDQKRRNRRVASGVVALLIAAAGLGGVLVAFRDSGRPKPGESPSPSQTPTGEPSIGSVASVSGPIQFVDSLHGWMVGANGEILATVDGGGAWDVQYNGQPASAVDFVDIQSGWALTEAGVVRTTDGGAVWELVSSQTLRSVQFVSPEVGWAISMKPNIPEGVGQLLLTTDGGLTWDRETASLSVTSVCANETGQIVWAAGPGEGGISFIRTDDGWATGVDSPIRVPEGEPWMATVRCAGTGAWVLVTDGGAAGHVAYGVFRTVDGLTGSDYPTEAVLQEDGTHPFGESVPHDLDPYPGQLIAFDGQTAYVVGWCPPCGGDLPVVAISRTFDGGSTWDRSTIVSEDRAAEPLGVSFVDRDRGWILLRALGDGSLFVLSTSDGGVTWSEP